MMAAAPNAAPVSTAFRLRRCLGRAGGMALLWLGLNGLDGSSWIVGGPVVLAAAWISVRLLPAFSWRWSAGGALAFAAYFLLESVRGGWDVARRAFSPRLALSPAIVCHSFHLPPGPARLFFCSAISLLPGTAVVAIAEESLCIHVLDGSPRVEEELRALERHVGVLFGLELTDAREPAA
ncbi:MAG TPA: Na+/H+ antiporter subunit E [Verrucomicrobiota bacterium]|nr:Na+/H+ antiporter subunit E [Verrucomicrobiota bacterium]HNU50373.1 Na+/H+ antiporter subunit E [Verrucomicrobiota bacterium]